MTGSPRNDFVAGVRDVSPTLVGVAPFGLIAGAAAVGAGLSVLQAMGLSVFVFAGASQLAAIDLIDDGAPFAVVVATALVINLRMLMYSASLAPYLRDLARRWRAFLAYGLVDQVYAFAVLRFDREDRAESGHWSDGHGATPGDGPTADGEGGPADTDVSRRWYYLGLAAPLWLTWQATTFGGAVVGARLPAWLPLEFAVPLTFLALLVPAVEGRATGAAAAVGGGVAVLGVGVPFNAGLLVGALAGVVAGIVVETRGWAA